MDEKRNAVSIDLAELNRLAEIEFPMPEIPCPFKTKKILWLREKWVNAQLSEK